MQKNKAIHPKKKNNLFKINELADDLNTTPRTIRLYNTLEIITPHRTAGGTRVFTQKDRKRMEVALRLSRVGIDLETIRTLAKTRAACNSGTETLTKVAPLLEDLHNRIRNLNHDLDILHNDLEQAKQLISQCGECKNKPNRQECPTCPINKHIDTSGIVRLIWDPTCP